MNRKLKLRTGVPVWVAYDVPDLPIEDLKRDIRCDVLVVGLGISGAMIIEALTAQGLSVVGVDRRGPILGSTAATTALVQFELDMPITRLATKIGREDAERAWRRSKLAISNLRARIAELRINCNVADRQSVYLAGNALGSGELRDEANARREAGIGSTFLSRKQLNERFGIDRSGAILSYENLAVDPRKLTCGLLLKALERGARLYAPVEVVEISDGDNEVSAQTKAGQTIRAKNVVLATGYELMDVVPSDMHKIISTFAIATKPQKNAIWPSAAFLWEASDPYLYVRSTDDGRVICGGEDEDFQDEAKRDALLPGKTQRISAKLKRLLPHIDATAAYAWTGCFGTTATGMPYIGELPSHKGVFAVQGYGGNGITFSQIASEIVTTAITGGNDSDAGLFAFGPTGLLRKLVDVSAAAIRTPR